MSRSIEFRGYLNGEVVTGLLLYKGSFYDGWRAFEGGVVFEAPVVQYTGLKDSTGKKIFEGDILSDWGFGGTLDDPSCRVVAFEHGGFTPSSSYKDYGKDITTYLVVGNIHENPEMVDTNSAEVK